MHDAQRKFVAGLKARFPDRFVGKRVFEFGSRDINGSVRPYFEGCEYTGIDIVDGDGVDVVADCLDFNPDHLADVVISCEMLEHDPHPMTSVWHMVECLKPGGFLVVTCATTGRPKHGTTDTGDGEAYGPVPDHYHNVTAQQFMSWTLSYQWLHYHVSVERRHHDLQFWGVLERHPS